MVQTIKLKGNDYATVPQRLKEFREKNPRASITTKPTITDGVVVFEAHIKSDQSKADSPEATGHAYGKLTGEKAFEKLETVACGRALSLLGYLNNGQVASTEEMQEFEEYRLEKYKTDIEQAQSVDELMAIFNQMNSEEKKTFTESLGVRKKELLDEAK